MVGSEADAAVLHGTQFRLAQKNNLNSILHEAVTSADVNYVAMVAKDVKQDVIKKAGM